MEVATEIKFIPKLRFHEFKDFWKEKYISNILTIGSGRDYKHLENGDIPVYGTGGYMTSVNKFLYNGESVCIGRKGTIDKPCYYNEKFWTVDTLFYTHEFIDSLPKFVYNLFQRVNWKLYNEASGVPSLSKKTIESIKLNLPTLPEQQKISTFLSAVDKKIEQLSNKNIFLETYKKGVIEKIFSQELRFKKDDGSNYPDWEVKRLEEIVNDFIVPMRDKPKKLNGSVPWCRIEDFEGKHLFKSKSNQGVSVETIKEMNLKVYPKNTLLVSCSANLGFCAIVGAPLITNQTFIGLVPSEKINVELLFYMMKKSAKKLNRLSSGTTISYLSRKEFEKFELKIPIESEEQNKIASFLSAIDRKIELVNTQLGQNKVFKKGLLQKMFV